MSTPLLRVIGLEATGFDATGFGATVATAFDWPPLAASPTMSSLLRPAPALPIHATCQTALETFLADAALIALPVLNEDASPSAIIDRFPFVEFFSRRYRRELFGERGLGHFLEEHPEVFPARKPLVVQIDASLDDAARILMSAHPNQLTSALLVAQGARYQGIASSLELLNELARRKQEELFFLAHYDALTQIPNRMLFTDRLGQACREALRSGREVGLLFVDVDRFKQVNDSLGHAFGDELLCTIARRMQACARDCDTVARLGGDEFAVLMDDVHGRTDTEALAQRLVEAMREPVRILDREVRVSLSIGIALYPRDDRDSETLLSKADAAMYEVKTSGRNGYRHFEAGVSSFSSERSCLEAELKQAVARNEFTLCYQPQIHLASGEVVGVEALIRWKHPHRGLLSPGSFIEIAEESGLIVPISDWVLSEASRQHRDWRRQGMPSLRMGINISSLQFHQPDFVKRVKHMLSQPGIDPAMIEFELTESSVMCKASTVLDMLNELKAEGVGISLDDFGTGYSSLSYLSRYPIDRLKIDQSFVRDIDRMPVNVSIIVAITALAKSLGLKVIAEGVETEAELARVRECKCDESQGYLHARPMSAEALAGWLHARDAGLQ